MFHACSPFHGASWPHKDDPTRRRRDLAWAARQRAGDLDQGHRVGGDLHDLTGISPQVLATGGKKRWETPADMLLLLLLLLFAEHLRGPLRTWFSARSLMVGGVEPSCHCLTM